MLIRRNRAYCSLALLSSWNRCVPSVSSATAAFAPAFACVPLVSPVSIIRPPRSFSDLRMSSSSSSSNVVNVAAHLDEVRESIADVCQMSGRAVQDVRLVAVSKTKPLELVQAAYEAGQRVFGENYAQELVEKAEAMKDHAEDIQWHFIGSLQSNKANMLVKGVVPYGKLVIETIASLKVAKKLETAMSELEGQQKTLEVFVQINTSGEDSKSGVEPDDAIELCQQIVKECEHVKLKGVMTIGAPGDLSCLDALVSCRNRVAESLDMDPNDLEVSMGMSDDYVEAIRKGSTNIRVGSTIFGARDYSNK